MSMVAFLDDTTDGYRNKKTPLPLPAEVFLNNN